MKKRMLGMITTIAIILSNFVYSASAEIKTESPFEVASFLNRIGISAVYSEDSYMTRGDFAVLAVEIMKTDVLTEESFFTDVSGEQAKYINTAAYMGIVSVNAEKKFYPERIITVGEAAAILIRILGYDALMTDKTFPMAYINEAIKLRLLVNVSQGSQLTGADVSYMIFNMLNCRYVKQEISTSKDDTYFLSNNTCLEEQFNIYKKTGIITSICGLTINGKKGSSSDKVVISNMVYENPYYYHVKNYTYLGHRVDYYIMKTDNSYEVVFIQDFTDTLKIYANKVNKAIGFDSSDPIVYKRNPELSFTNDSEKTEKVNIDVNASIYINATNSISVSNSDFTPEAGVIYLTDSNGDGKYDVIFIEKYYYYFISAFDDVDRVIADKYGKEPIKLDNFNENKILLEENNAPIDDSFFAEGVVLEVMCSYKKNGTIDYNKFAKISLADEKIKGVMDSYEDNVFYVNGYPYTAHSDVIDDLRTQIGIENNYYVGCGGVIIAFDRNAIKDGSVYAYLVGIYPYGDLEKKYAFKMFSEKGEYLLLDAAETVYYRGMYDGNYVERKKLKDDDILNINEKELIKFKTNDDGLITDVYSACDMTGDVDYIGFDENRFTLDYKKNGFLLYNGITDDGYIMSSASPCIFINGDGEDEEDYEIGPYNMRGSIIGEKTENVNIKIYDAARNLTGTIAVIENAPLKDETVGEKFYSASTMWVVTGKRRVLNEDDEYQCRIEVARGSQEQRFFAKSDDLAPLNAGDSTYNDILVSKFEDLEVGDIISVQLNTEGDISAYIVINDYDKNHNNKLFNSYARQKDKDYLASFRRMYGTVTKFVAGSYVKIDSDSSYSNKRFSIGRNTPTYMIINTDTGEVISKGASTVLTEGDYVWAYANKGEIRMLVKYVKE